MLKNIQPDKSNNLLLALVRHKRNKFNKWSPVYLIFLLFHKQMRQTLWPQHPLPGREHYDQRCAWLLARGLGLWDVYASCERVGSLDTRIRNAQVNDFASLRARCPRLAAIAHNGGESFRHARSTALLGVPVDRLPSTSPANASWSFDRKLTAWADLLARHGLV